MDTGGGSGKWTIFTIKIFSMIFAAIVAVIIAVLMSRLFTVPKQSGTTGASPGVSVVSDDLRFGHLPNCKGQTIVCEDPASEITCDDTTNQLRCEDKCRGQTYSCDIGQEVFCDSANSRLACRSVCDGSPVPPCSESQTLRCDIDTKQYVCKNNYEDVAHLQAKAGMTYKEVRGELVEFNRCDQSEKPTCFDEGYGYSAPQCQLTQAQAQYQWVCPCQKDYIASLAPPPPPSPQCIIHSKDQDGEYYSDGQRKWYYSDREGNYHYNCLTQKFEFVMA